MNNRTFIFEFSFRLRRNMMIWKAGNHLTLCLVYIIMLINKTGVWLALKAFFTELLWLYYRQLTIMVKFCLRVGQRTLNWLHVDPRALLRVTTREDELWGTLEQNCLRLASAKNKNKKVVLIGPFKFARERLNVRRVWLVSRFFPRNIEVNTLLRTWATPAHSWFHRFSALAPPL